jgi:PAS domain S-box-containing protein
LRFRPSRHETSLDAACLNKAGQKLVGFDSWEEARARRGIHYIFPADRQFVNEVLWPTALEKGSWSGEMRFCHFKTGDPIPVLYSAFRIDDPETGQPVNVGNVCRDITERKRAEGEARENERCYCEMQVELAHANRVATMGQLTASIAHEVNQPIVATVTNAEAALRWLGAGSSHRKGAAVTHQHRRGWQPGMRRDPSDPCTYEEGTASERSFRNQ